MQHVGGRGSSMWSLNDLIVPFEELAAREPPSEEVLRDLVRQMHQLWVDPDVDMADMFRWSLERYHLDPSGNFTFPDFEANTAIAKYQYKQLLNLVTNAGLFEHDGQLIDDMTTIQHVMSASRKACVEVFVLFNRMEGSRNNAIPPSVVDEDTFENHDPKELTSFQNLVIRILKQLYIKQLRKNGDGCYEQIVTAEGHNTHAFRFVCTIEQEVWSIQKEVSFELWKYFTNPRDNPRATVEHLTKSKQAEFPDIDVGDGHWFSFENGLYNVRHDLFFEYDEDHAAYAKAMQEARGRDEPYPVPDTNTVAINYFPVVFRNPPTPDEPIMKSVDTPSFDKIFQTQHFDADTCRWAYIMIGRLFFRCNILDRWQRVLFMIGGGGTGKSTIAVWLQYVFANFYSLINSNFEEQFGLGPLCNDRFRVCMCTEMGEDIRMKQEEFQICAEGGEQQAAKKGVDSFPYKWKQHMIFCGNQFPRRWKNNGKQISRRAFLLSFQYLVKKSAIDTGLNDRLRAETDLLIRKCTTLYVQTAMQNATADLEAPGLMPDQVRDFMQSFETAIDPLANFMDVERFEYDPSNFMPLDEFKRHYFDYRKANGFPTVTWTRDHYTYTFKALDVGVVRHTMTYKGRERNTEWIVGLTMREDEME